MKNSYKYFMAGLLFVVLVFNFAQAKDPNYYDPRFTEDKLNRIEKNLVIALKSSIPTLQASAALVLKQVKSNSRNYEFSSAIIPLMSMLKNERHETNVRIAAALALQDLRSTRGDFAIKRTAQFTDNERLKHLCFWLTYERSKGD